MKQLFVPYSIARPLKDFGFDEPCLGAFSNKNDIMSGYIKNAPKGFLKAPLYQQVMRHGGLYELELFVNKNIYLTK